MPSHLRVIVGLGNPGREYERTRHNAGFWLAEALAEKRGARFAMESRFRSELAKTDLEGGSVWILKPMTFMNSSGEAVQSFAAFHKIPPAEILVVHDELDLPVGSARLKSGGGHGGHNGLRSIHRHIGEDYLRLRLGVGHPGTKERVHGYLTEERTPATEADLIKGAIARALETMPLLASRGVTAAMQHLHSNQD